MSDEGQELVKIFGAAVLQIGEEPREVSARQGRCRLEPRILSPVTRDDGERKAVRFCGARHLLDAVAPIIEPAEQAHQHETRMRDHALDIAVDREGMAERRKIGEAQAREAFLPGFPGVRDPREIAVREGEEHHFGG